MAMMMSGLQLPPEMSIESKVAVGSREVAALESRYLKINLQLFAEKSELSIKNIYNSIKQAPKYPQGFNEVNNGTVKVKVKNTDVLSELRQVESGQWKKVYKDGYDANGSRISIHYFQSESGKVFDVKVKQGWSNK